MAMLVDAPVGAGRLRCRALGGLAVDMGGRPADLGGPKQRAVLATLLAAPGRAVSVERMVDQVWGDDPPERAETSLQAYVSNLRRVLEPDRRPREAPRVLVTRPAGYALVVDPCDVDLTHLEERASEGHARLRSDDPAGAIAALEEALALWLGPPLPELAGTPWVDALTARLTQVRLEAIEDRVEAALALGESGRLVADIESAIDEHPFRERLRGHLALALYRSGRQRDALEALQRARRVLADEVGVEPGPELQRLEAAVLDQDPALDHLPGAAGPVGADSGTTAPPVTRGGPTAGPQAAPGPEPAADPADRAIGTDRHLLGRAHEMAALRAAADAALAGAGRAVVISGEPGIGKTRLAEELTRGVAGATVAWGRCPESAGQAAYWPLLQVGRQLEGAGVLDDGAVAALLPDPDAPPSADPIADRLALHTAIVDLLAEASEPIVAVVDDLQWADPASLRALEFLAGGLRALPVLLVLTIRPVPAEAAAPVIDCLAELARQSDTVRLDLTGLEPDDVRRWIDAGAARRADRRVVAEVHDRTGGNPFFVGEVVSMLRAEGHLSDPDAMARSHRVPGAVQDVIRRRVGRLPASCQQLLSTASIVGRTFSTDVLAAVTDRTPIDVLDDLEPALAAGLVEETDVPGRFAFSHALVGDTLAAELTAVRRARTHAAVATALAELRSADIRTHLSEVAHHAFEGAAAGSAEQAVVWCRRAAEEAASRLASEDAATEWGRALAALDLARPGDRAARLELLLELARSHIDADDVQAAFAVLASAIDLGIALDDAARVGEAASLANVEGLWMSGEMAAADTDIVGALGRALEVIDPAPSVVRVRALGALVENAYFLRPAAELDELSGRAVAMARQLGDPAVLARALHKRVQGLWRPSTNETRLAVTEELLAVVAEEDLPAELRCIALFDAASVAWESGDVRGAERQVDQALDLATKVGSPALLSQLGYFQGSIATFLGRLEVAEAAIRQADELYRRTRRWAADTFAAAFLAYVAMERDRADEVLTLQATLEGSPYAPVFAEAYALAHVEMGHLDQAAALVSGMPLLLDTWMDPALMVAAARTRVALGDRETAAALVPLLTPLAGRLGCSGTGPALGDLDLALARIHHLLGDDELARRHADGSVALLERTGDTPWLARSLAFRAELRDDPTDHDRALAVAGRLGLPLLLRML